MELVKLSNYEFFFSKHLLNRTSPSFGRACLYSMEYLIIAVITTSPHPLLGAGKVLSAVLADMLSAGYECQGL